MNNKSINAAASLLGCKPDVIKAVMNVESAGSSFFPDGSIKLRFEGHKFSLFTKGRFDKTHPALSYPSFNPKMSAGNWLGEKARFAQASGLDRTAAIKASSLGAFQIMGYHYTACGRKSPEALMDYLSESEDNNCMAFALFVKNMSIDKYLKNENFSGFAKAYNGPQCEKNNYPRRMEEAFKLAQAGKI